MNFDFICFKNTALATITPILSMIIILACQYAALAIVVKKSSTEVRGGSFWKLALVDGLPLFKAF